MQELKKLLNTLFGLKIKRIIEFNQKEKLVKKLIKIQIVSSKKSMEQSNI